MQIEKKRLHIHSDNDNWAGSENMPGIFLQHEMIKRKFVVTFSYRNTREYVNGMRKWVPGLEAHFDPYFPPYYPMNSIMTWIHKRPRPFQALRYLIMPLEIKLCKKILRFTKPDRVHINNGGYPGALTCNAMAIAAKDMGIPMVTYMINSTFRDLWWERAIGMTYKVKDSVDRWVTASLDLGRESEFLHDYTKLRIIPNTILPRKMRMPEVVKRDLGIPKEKLMFVGVGVDEPRKGWDVLQSAWKEFRFNHLTDLVIQSRSNYNVDARSLINAADVLIVPSIADEDFPNVILMALALGRPIIASRLAGIPEQVDGSMSMLVTPGDVRELRDAMESLVTARNTRWAMEREALNLFDKKYRPEVVLQQWIDLWEGRETWQNQ